MSTLEKMRKKIANQKLELHGWMLEFTLRRNDRGRGDMCAIPPSGEKIFSILGVKRKLGLVAAMSEPAPRAVAAADAGRGDRAPALLDQPLMLSEGRARRARTTVNYAEMDGPGARGGAPRLKDLVIEQIGSANAPPDLVRMRILSPPSTRATRLPPFAARLPPACRPRRMDVPLSTT